MSLATQAGKLRQSKHRRSLYYRLLSRRSDISGLGKEILRFTWRPLPTLRLG